MTTELEYALMAGAAYFSTRTPINRFPVPTGWTQLGTSRDDSSGFEVVAFQQQEDPNNIVISYAGTYPGTADLTADAFLGLGKWSAQLGEAAALRGKVTMLFIAHALPKNLIVDEVIRIGMGEGALAVASESK